MEKKFRFTVLMVLALAVGLTAGAANAVLTAYEPFDYSVGEGLLGLNGGTGWLGAWRDGLYGGDPPLIAAGSPMPGGTGNHIELVSDYVGGGTGADFVRALETTFPDDGSTYWISLVYQKLVPEGNSTSWFWFWMGFGKGYTQDDFWLGEIPTGEPVTVLSTLVVKVETNATAAEQVYLWVNPPAGDEPATGTADAHDELELGEINSLGFSYGGGAVVSAHGDDFKLDEIKFGTTWDDVKPEPPCEKTSVPVPANDAQNVDPNILQLEWDPPTCVDSPTYYDVYLGTYYWGEPDPNFIIANAKIATGITDPYALTPVGDLSFDTDYNWRADVREPNSYAISAFADLGLDPNEVRATITTIHGSDIVAGSSVTITNTTNYNGIHQVTNVSDNTHFDFEKDFEGTETGNAQGTHVGFVCSFTTWPAEPLITTQPAAAQTVPVSGSASFTVVSGGNAGTGHTYQWYYHANPGDANSLMAGKTSATLNLTNIQTTLTEGNEGYYVCDVNNTYATYSDSGRILTPRLMAHWKFDNAGNGNYYDETGGTYNAKAADAGNPPSFVAGIDGQAVLIEGDPNKFIMVDTAIGLLNDITVSMWVKPADPNDAIFFAPQAGADEDYGGTAAVHVYQAYDSTHDNGSFMSEVTGGISTGEPNALTVGEWNHIVFVYDTNDTNAVGRYHVNGDLVPIDGVYEQLVNVSVLPNVLPASMGKRNGVDAYPFTFDQGLIDDVQVYNYALSPLVIAQMYVAFVPTGTPCIGPVEFDLNGDCIVSLAEYAELMDAWLDCNIVPDCIAPEIPQ